MQTKGQARSIWRCVAIATSFLLVASAVAAGGEAYPAHAIRLVVPFPPGGSTDILARPIAQKLSQALGQQVVVENRGGAGGTIGAAAVAQSAPDGYTLLMGHIGTLAVAPSLYPKLPYDPRTSFAPVSMVAILPNVLVVNPSNPAKNVREFIAYAKAHPGALTYSSGGNGSAAHIAFEMFKQEAGIDVVHIPYRGTAPSLTDVIAGQVAATMTGVAPVLPFVRSGQLRALGVSGRERSPALPDVPTIAEQGVKDFEATQWYGLVAPAGTPAAIVERLNSELRKILASSETSELFASLGAVPSPSSPEEFRKHIAREIGRWERVVRGAHIEAE